MKRKYITPVLLVLVILGATSLSSGENAVRDSSYTTAKGTKINVNATIEHDGLDSSSRPTMSVNSTYLLSIEISVTALGAEVLDLHDITFSISLTADSLIGDDLSYYQGYFLDKETKLLAGENKIYNIDMFISGGIGDNVATLKVEFVGKENVAENVDPTVTFDALQMEIQINPSSGTTKLGDLKGGETLSRSMEVFADKESKLRLEFFMIYEGEENDTSKPEILSRTKYLMTFNITVLSLGTDAADVHDIKILTKLEDESFTDIIPGNKATSYFAAGIEDTDTNMVADDTLTLYMVFYASTNINNSEVTLSIEYSVKENVQLIDPTTKWDLSVEFLLNRGIANVFDDLLSTGSGAPIYLPLIPLLFLLPILRKRRNN